MKTAYGICLAFGLVLMSCSTSSSERSLMNERNFSSMKLGMTLNEVREKMGVPDRVLIDPFNDKEFDVQYAAPSKYDDDFHIYVSRKDSIVLRIVDGH